jgi:hypothetical protein
MKYRAGIQLDIHVWERADAQNILEQIVKMIEWKSTTDLHGGTTQHHRIISTTLLEKGDE